MKLEWMMHFIAKHDACALRQMADVLHAMTNYADEDIADELAWQIIDGIPEHLLPDMDDEHSLADVYEAAFNIAANHFQLTV